MKIICLIFSNFLNWCQVHIYRKADALHKTGEEEGGGLLPYSCSYIRRKMLNSHLILPASKQGLDPGGSSSC